MLLWGLITCGLFAAEQEVRTWTDVNGRKIDAKLLEIGSDKITVSLKGKTVDILLNTLSEADREYVDEIKENGFTEQAEAGGGLEGSRAGEKRVFGGIEMVWCPPGKFLMGSPEGEEGRAANEKQHRVVLTKGFWLARTECTQRQWEAVAGSNPSQFKGEELPVETVNWDDVQLWLGKMNEKHPLPEGWKWELPTEAQWEYACRAGTDGAYGGAGTLDEMGWYLSKSGRKTRPVGGKKANAWGLYDMHGNVKERCRDRYGDYEGGSVTDPTGPATGTHRVNRGGSWNVKAVHCRSAYRGASFQDDRYSALGFRPAVVPSGG